METSDAKLIWPELLTWSKTQVAWDTHVLSRLSVKTLLHLVAPGIRGYF